VRVASLQGPLELGGDYWRWVQASRINRAVPEFSRPEQAENVGDWFVTQIVDRLVEFDELVLVPPAATPRQWDLVNETCDVMLLKGGNYLFPGFLRDHVGVEAIRNIRIPIVIMGAGIQDVGAGGVEFTPEDVEILRRIHDSCAASSVRGHLSAEVLAAIGIDNAIVTGCPTLFWAREPELTIRPPRPDHTGFTFRTWLYSRDDAPYVAQFRALEALRGRSDRTSVILQGEELPLQQLHIARNWGATFAGSLVWDEDAELNRLVRTRLDPDGLVAEIHAEMDAFAAPELIDWVTEQTFFSWDVADYMELYRSLGLVLGCRLHSNLLSLANGTPAFYLTYDDRTREIVELLALPSCDVLEAGDGIDPFAADWSPFEVAYRRQYAEMLRFLEANALAHRLPAPVAG